MKLIRRVIPLQMRVRVGVNLHTAYAWGMKF